MATEGLGSHNCRCGLTSLFYTAWSNLGTVPPQWDGTRCSSRISALRLSHPMAD